MAATTPLIEDYIPFIKYNGYNSDKAMDLGSTLNVDGAATFGSTLNVTGAVTITGQLVENVEVVTATNVIAASESGKTFYLDAVAGFESTLPTAALGLMFKFIVKTSPTSNGYTITGSPADKIYGIVAASGAETEANGVAAAAADNIILVANQSIIGDFLEFHADATNWYVTGNVNLLAAVTANG